VQGKNSSTNQAAAAGGANTGSLPPAITSGVFDERAFEHAGGQDTPMPMSQDKPRISPAQVAE
jgi:hypothetical protein